MMSKLNAFWQRFRADRPGQRFQNLHRSRQKGKKVVRILNVAGGIALGIVGLVLVPAPGPGWAIVIVGLGLLASEILVVARWLDSVEMTLRGWARRCRALAKTAG